MSDSQRTLVLCLALLITGAVLGGLGVSLARPSNSHPEPAQTEDRKVKFWSCNMDTQVREPSSGPCPLCGMPMIPIYEDLHLRPGQLALSAAATRLAEVRTDPVQRIPVRREIRLEGKIAYNETRVDDLTAWVPGRIDDLYVNFTGLHVRKGDHMAKLYSPALISAQEELIRSAEAYQEAKLRVEATATPSESLTWQLTDTQRNLESAREKLRLLGLQPKQIDHIQSLLSPDDHVIIYAPSGGVVIDKHVQKGMYVKTGMRLYTIADLSQVWVELNAYEEDVPWLSLYEKVTFTTEAYPGETFPGQITFIQPVLDNKTRTIKVRVDVKNPALKLKPDMFVRAIVRVGADANGPLHHTHIPGAWACPMHLEVYQDKPGACHICGMALEKTESLLQFAPSSPERTDPLVIPASAPLITGKRAIVYVKVPDEAQNKHLFEGRVVVLGHRVTDVGGEREYYIVRSGLAEGERVVTRGNFKIDAEMQIRGEPSMMNRGGLARPTTGHSGAHAVGTHHHE